ncbi:RNA polymerase sigma factor [Sphingomonas sp. Leaf62]|uniref:RNA polymerase sigma factor n=1 Tax=Sphingomonas sp. Leaf62 TaxID=1736228 RepID=UPI0006F6FFFA|nr:RNA polymerase sigma factor [Sphingomonas sp. Leaf62]KQN78481.1 RNA polymerase subunit sigma-24 [Sphingomonas sp. Leaf62]
MTVADPGPDDGDLAAKALAGSEAAFASLMQRHRSRVYRLILNSVGDPDEALDLVQETFLSAYRALGRYDGSRPMAAWLATIALNKCRDLARRRALRRFFFGARSVDEMADSIATNGPDQAVAAEQRQETARLRAAIAMLPATLREPLLLCTVEEMRQSDAAALLGISTKAVETRIRRARIRLAELLAG